jgi:hypothetical protein
MSDAILRIFQQSTRPRRNGSAHATLLDLVQALESNQPVPQKSRVHLLFGLKDYLAQDGRVALEACLARLPQLNPGFADFRPAWLCNSLICRISFSENP